MHWVNDKGFYCYIWGTSTVESSNNVLELALPKQCGAGYYKMLLLITIMSANVDAAQKCANQFNYGTDNLSLLVKVHAPL